MNIGRFKQQLIIDEGYENKVYLDSKGLPTFGIGHLLTKYDIEYYAYTHLPPHGTLTVSDERINQVFEKDVSFCIKDCHQLFNNFEQLPEEAQEIIANMMFNLGLSRLSKFHNFISAINKKNWQEAANQMIDSDWYLQTKNRAKRLVSGMKNIA